VNSPRSLPGLVHRSGSRRRDRPVLSTLRMVNADPPMATYSATRTALHTLAHAVPSTDGVETPLPTAQMDVSPAATTAPHRLLQSRRHQLSLRLETPELPPPDLTVDVVKTSAVRLVMPREPTVAAALHMDTAEPPTATASSPTDVRTVARIVLLPALLLPRLLPTHALLQ